MEVTVNAIVAFNEGPNPTVIDDRVPMEDDEGSGQDSDNYVHSSQSDGNESIYSEYSDNDGEIIDG